MPFIFLILIVFCILGKYAFLFGIPILLIFSLVYEIWKISKNRMDVSIGTILFCIVALIAYLLAFGKQILLVLS